MRKKHTPDMTDSEFVYLVGLLNASYTKVGKLVGRSLASISQYANGGKPIPPSVSAALRREVDDRKQRFLAVPWLGLAGKTVISDADLMEANHKIRQASAKDTPALPRLIHRHKPAITQTFPVYRMSAERMRVYLEALNTWAAVIRTAHKQASDERTLRGYALELADLKALAEFARGATRKGAPYDVCITHSEWLVVSRALRHLYDTRQSDAAYALYEHWRAHKGCGYPI